MNLIVFSSLVDILHRFYASCREFRFESHLFKFKKAKRKGRVVVFLFRCEREQLNIKISLRKGVPVFVESVYSIDTLQL